MQRTKMNTNTSFECFFHRVEQYMLDLTCWGGSSFGKLGKNSGKNKGPEQGLQDENHVIWKKMSTNGCSDEPPNPSQSATKFHIKNIFEHE